MSALREAAARQAAVRDAVFGVRSAGAEAPVIGGLLGAGVGVALGGGVGGALIGGGLGALGGVVVDKALSDDDSD